jgi:dihydrofolate reductase
MPPVVRNTVLVGLKNYWSKSMAKVIFGMTMSLDGFINDASGGVALLYPDLKELDQTELMQEAIRTTGAVVMGRRTFDMASDADSYADSYEFQVPIFVITEQAPERKPKENGRISFTFVDTVEAAIQQAKQAAGEKDVAVVGGPNVKQHSVQFLPRQQVFSSRSRRRTATKYWIWVVTGINLVVPAGAIAASSHLSDRLARLTAPAQGAHRAASPLLICLFTAAMIAAIFGTVAHTACCFVLKH